MLQCICDEEDDDNYILRSQFDSPDVDSVILVNKDKKLQVGEFYNVKLVQVENSLDFKGEIV